MYYPSKAKELALSNNQVFHHAAWAKRGNSMVFGVNSDRCSTRFKRIHPDGTSGFHLHAEMDLLRRFEKGSVKEISVIRFSKRGEVTMSKPCAFCQKFLISYGVRKVRYTGWDGAWKTMKL